MGQTKSAFPESQLTNSPWRRGIYWTKEFEKQLFAEIKAIKPEGKRNLLMIGPVGSGKSSFINAVISVAEGRKYCMALTGNTGQGSCTTEFDGFNQTELLQGYNLMDSVGIEQGDMKGFNLEDIEFLLKGHIKEGYKFNPNSAISEENKHFRRNPTLNDQCHCVILVVSATAILAEFDKEYIMKIKILQKKIRQAHIPRVLVLTKVDELCDEVNGDISLVFKSTKVKKALKKASEIFEIEQSCIHPIKNYEVDFNVEFKTNIPILLALRQTMQFAADRIGFALRKEKIKEDTENN